MFITVEVISTVEGGQHRGGYLEYCGGVQYRLLLLQTLSLWVQPGTARGMSNDSGFCKGNSSKAESKGVWEIETKSTLPVAYFSKTKMNIWGFS